MIQAYKDGKDLYALMAAHVFSLVAQNLAHELNAQTENRFGTVTIAEYNPDKHTEHLSPIKKQLVDDKFVYYDNQIGQATTWRFKELTPEDCYDGTMYRKVMKTLLLGGLTPHLKGETLGEPYCSRVSLNVA
jgi:hypothetical protein